MVLGFFIGFGAAGMEGDAARLTGVTVMAVIAALAARRLRRESVGMMVPCRLFVG
jgi:hypothetical protein